MSKLIATEIKWDIDEDDDIELPKNMKIPENIVDEEEISNYLTEQTGYCHKGFVIEKL